MVCSCGPMDINQLPTKPQLQLVSFVAEGRCPESRRGRRLSSSYWPTNSQWSPDGHGTRGTRRTKWWMPQRMELLEDQNGSNQYLGGSFAFELRAVIIVLGWSIPKTRGLSIKLAQGRTVWLSLEEWSLGQVGSPGFSRISNDCKFREGSMEWFASEGHHPRKQKETKIGFNHMGMSENGVYPQL